MKLDELKYASRFDNVSGSAIREIFKLIAKPGMISFAGGNPAKSALPDDVCAQIAKEVLQQDGKAILQYGATEGYAPLLESLRTYVQEVLGCPVNGILPTTGSTQGMDLLCKALIAGGDGDHGGRFAVFYQRSPDVEIPLHIRQNAGGFAGISLGDGECSFGSLQFH
jgi:2-aminoadipate transaminase